MMFLQTAIWFVLCLVVVYCVIGSIAFIRGMCEYHKRQREFEGEMKQIRARWKRVAGIE